MDLHKLKISLLLLLFSPFLFGQGDIEDLLFQEVDNLNPVYKPVLGVGVGSFTFLGDVRDPLLQPENGSFGYKVNLSTFVDNNHYIRANFYFVGGSLISNERSYSDLSRNLNFKSDILLFGVNLNYDFDNLYKKYRKVHPFISLGAELLTFDSKIDSFTYVEGLPVQYNYWNDGTIRGVPQTSANAGASLLQRDYIYETNLRDTDWGLGEYPQYTFAIPIEFGLDFFITNRIMFRVAASYHFTFTDVIDHVSSKNTSGVIGNKWNDDFLFTYASLHLDLFSSKKTLTIERLFADVDFDMTLMGDQDNDGYFDGWDDCPNTPFGVKVDTTGCPVDADFDGIPDYLDQEPNSRYGAYVDENGRETSEDALIAKLSNQNAVRREDVELYLRTFSSYAQYKTATSKQIPEKFRKLDIDNDGYLSYDEMMKGIDKFFDFDSELTANDIYELNEFFFSQ